MELDGLSKPRIGYEYEKLCTPLPLATLSDKPNHFSNVLFLEEKPETVLISAGIGLQSSRRSNWF